MPENITLRNQLVGSVSDFCKDSELDILKDPLLLVELAVLLSNYAEEGKVLSPDVYLTDDIDAVMKMLPDGEKLKIGELSDIEGSPAKCLKKCAPLASNIWHIYIDRKKAPNMIEFGMFRGSTKFTSFPTEETLLSFHANDTKVNIVKVSRIALSCVEIRSNRNGKHTVFFSHAKDSADSPLKNIKLLTDSVTRKVDEIYGEQTNSFVYKVLKQTIQDCHGCLVAVTNMKRVPAFLANDAVILEQPIDFGYLVNMRLKDEVSDVELIAKLHLLDGMFNSDGIVLFDQEARVLAYNCFTTLRTNTAVVGGARKRAFEALKSKFGKGLSAAYIGSQDGQNNFEEIR